MGVRTVSICCIFVLAAGTGAWAQNLNSLSDSFRELARRVHPSVVKVVASGFRALNEDDETAEAGVLIRQQSAGSGVILDSAGLIVTNAHVVAGARKIQVTLAPANEEGLRSEVRPAGKVLTAEVLGFDTESDIALLKVSRAGLPALTLADSEQVEQGQIVLAFGSPLGLDNSVTFGVVSSTARQLKPDDPMIYLQTDAPINPGSSGGPLVDTAGRVVGINTLILSQSGGNEGVGFAVPSNIVANVMEQLRTTGRVVRGEVGLYVQTVTPPLAAAWKLDRDWGVVVSDVEPDSPAEKAGLTPGDLIRKLDGKVMENARQFTVNVYRPPIGSKLELDVLRDGKPRKLSLEIRERKVEPERLVLLAGREENLIPQLGVFAIDLTDKVRDQMGETRRDEGVLIASRLEDAPLFEDGLKAGDVIYAMNRNPMKNVAEWRAALVRIKSGDPVALQIERHGRLLYLAFEMP